jgi:hopanoid biosynthesis associated protein HpnK
LKEQDCAGGTGFPACADTSTAPSLRQVIFTADDFGLSPALNAAVALAHKDGVLTCAGLMPGAHAAAEALGRARDLPGLCLGVHLTLCQGRAVLPPDAIPRLVDAEGNFPQHPAATGWRYFSRPHLLPQIRRELAAQIEAVLSQGLTPWFVNGHLNLHLHPRLAPVVIDLAREYRIPAIRLVREDWRASLAAGAGRPAASAALALTFACLSKRARRLAQDAGLVFNDHLFGLLHDGEMTEGYVLGLLPRLKPGVTEIYSHPAVRADAELLRAAPRYRRSEELAALLSPRLKEALARLSIIPTDFRELARQQGRT